MWLPKSISGENGALVPFLARILYSDRGKVKITGMEKVGNVEDAQPYGFRSVMPRGTKAVVLPVDGSAVVCGALGEASLSLSEGEVGLYSSGGASIVLKNDGTVLINGKVFAVEEE